jgi:hypothetical protein
MILTASELIPIMESRSDNASYRKSTYIFTVSIQQMFYLLTVQNVSPIKKWIYYFLRQEVSTLPYPSTTSHFTVFLGLIQ